jgi:hypothetical protein
MNLANDLAVLDFVNLVATGVGIVQARPRFDCGYSGAKGSGLSSPFQVAQTLL